MGATGEERDRLVFKKIPAIFTYCKSHYHEEKGFRGNHGRVRVRVTEKICPYWSPGPSPRSNPGFDVSLSYDLGAKE